MIVNDPIADMLTRIRNAQIAKHDSVVIPASNAKKAIAKILLDEGYIKSYERIDDAGLHITVDGAAKTLPVDTIVVCAGQESQRELQAPLEAAGIPVSLIGGADLASELDAKRAIDQGTRLAASL